MAIMLNTIKTPEQLAFGFERREQMTFEHFCSGRNQQLFSQLQTAIKSNTDPYIYWWGSDGVGCSHLLQASCHYAEQLGLSAAYIPLSQWQELSPTILENMDQLSLICLDDLDLIANQPEWEEAVFHLFNRIKATGNKLFIAAHKNPTQAGYRLADLVSRLQWGLVFQVLELSDNEKLAILKQKALARGFILSNEVGQYLLRRCSRAMDDLAEILDKLDSASLSQQRKLTIPFVKSILAI